MTVRVKGSPDEVEAQLGSAVASVGWTLRPPAAGVAGLCQLVPPGDAPAVAQAGWLWCESGEGGAAVTIWLPDDGAPQAREQLEAAIEALDPILEGDQSALLRRLRRIEGQIRGLQRMIAKGEECEAVMTQWAAVSAALKQAAARLVSDHLLECVREEVAAGGSVQELNQRLLKILF